MPDEAVIQSPKWGTLRVYREYNEDRDIVWLTVYMKTPDHLYRVYKRHEAYKGVVSHSRGDERWETYEEREEWVDDKEVDWSGYIMGKKNHRLDFEVPAKEIETAFNLDLMIQKEFDDDVVYGYHFEKIPDHEPEWADMDDEELFDMYWRAHDAAEQAEKQMIESRRVSNRLWVYGDDKYNWADRL